MEPITSAVPSAVRTLLRRGDMSPGKLRLAWRVAVGSAIDRATSVSLREDKSVEVVAAEAAWRRELKRSQGEILAKLQDLLGPGVITKLRIVGKPRTPSSEGRPRA